jgi:glycosyltransferase involved in cell wall biosynthesis
MPKCSQSMPPERLAISTFFQGEEVEPPPLHVLKRRICELGWTLYYDVSPLLEEHWTGIPLVAARLGEVLFETFPQNVRFFYENHLVSSDAVVDAFGRNSGLFLHRDFFKGDACEGPMPLLQAGSRAAGIFPSVKRVRRIFPIECSLVHDLSTLITPQFHVSDTIRYHMETICEDLASNTVTFAVSRATLEDLKAYFGIGDDRLCVAYNGVSWPWWFPIQLANEAREDNAEPYFLILGTREPRKNIACIFDLLNLFPDLLEQCRFVIVGRMGWLAEQQAIPAALEAAIAEKRLILPGFVSEFEKYRLLCGATATIYPSFFEGFGLPILESLSVGTPCIASFSSAIPEVGGDLCTYFDPFSVESLYRAVRKVLAGSLKSSREFRAGCRAVAKRFTWRNTARQILSVLLGKMEQFESFASRPIAFIESHGKGELVLPSPVAGGRRRANGAGLHSA